MKNLITDNWNSNKSKLRKFFHIITSQELMHLSEPCYSPKLRRYEDHIYHIIGVSKNDLKTEITHFYKGTAAEKWLLENDSMSNLLILIMHFFIIKKDMIGFRSAMLFYNLRQYSNLFHRNFTFCQTDVFLYTLENISKSHIYSREKTISNAIYHFSNQMISRWQNVLKSYDNPIQISKFIRECRHRHAQSIKSFTKMYYKNSEDGNKINQSKEEIYNKESGETTQIEISQKTPKKIIELVNKITIHRYVDIKAIESSLKLNSINKIYGQLIVKEISNHKNYDILISIYKSYINNIKDIASLCSNKFINDVKNIIRSKNSHTKFFKTTCVELLENCIENSNLKKNYDKLSIQSKYTYLNFIIFYLCWSLKNYVCKK